MILKSLNHPSVLHYYGVTKKDSQMLMVTEYCPNGDLQNYLYDQMKTLDNVKMIQMILEIAQGMSYMHKNGIIHRDLAARNILVSQDGKMKISDFGLSRRTDTEYYRAEAESVFAIRWSSPEVISHRKYSFGSDVWAFGVVVWEVFSFGTRPYLEMENPEVLKYVLAGKKLMKPENCNGEVWQIVVECFDHDPEKRPTFEDILKRLQTQFGQSLSSMKMSFLKPTQIEYETSANIRRAYSNSRTNSVESINSNNSANYYMQVRKIPPPKQEYYQ
eukprot:TRINITY_DN7664_c0_g1_i2.p1 TRINITY_DN7664_c0_g1~~TRINITY_DN7664_c0_g1_i2.p1  ORF type:complete len:274 (-),score=63.25 TRINITY_DN7664_c0_g1_i2:46-867(-)